VLHGRWIFTEVYHDAMVEFHKQYPGEEFKRESIEKFAKKCVASKEEEDMFIARHKSHRMGLGANMGFLGTGVTKNLNSHDDGEISSMASKNTGRLNCWSYRKKQDRRGIAAIRAIAGAAMLFNLNR
jgi:hypothetical protein